MLLIYQMGKVASVSILETLKSIYPGGDIRHLHVIAHADFWRDFHEGAKARGDTTPEQCDRLGAIHATAVRTQEDLQRHHAAGEKAMIITGIREPMSYAISALFENINLVAPISRGLYRTDPGFAEVLQTYFVDVLRCRMRGEPLQHSCDIITGRVWEFAARWFELEFEPVTGIDIGVFEDVREHGYKIYGDDRFDVLFYRYEDRSRVLELALADFLELDELRLAQANVAADKQYAELYDRFCASFRLDDELLTPIYESRQVRTFYTDLEIDEFKARTRA